MPRALLLSLLLAACQSTDRKLPEGHAETRVHEEYDEYRPVAIAVLPVDAPSMTLRLEVRKELYLKLFDRRYSPFKLEVVDAHMALDGTFDAGSLDHDAALDVNITKWRAVKGTMHFAADGEATLRHRTGEVLWSCTFSDHAFKVPARAGETDEASAARDIAQFLVDRLPDRPPLPRE
jgi:hypothetical protein